MQRSEFMVRGVVRGFWYPVLGFVLPHEAHTANASLQRNAGRKHHPLRNPTQLPPYSAAAFQQRESCNRHPAHPIRATALLQRNLHHRHPETAQPMHSNFSIKAISATAIPTSQIRAATFLRRIPAQPNSCNSNSVTQSSGSRATITQIRAQHFCNATALP